jgi:hypothetical protein
MHTWLAALLFFLSAHGISRFGIDKKDVMNDNSSIVFC